MREVVEVAVVQAGWYPDQSSGLQQRWWDGSAWTERTRPMPPPMPPPDPAPAPPASVATPAASASLQPVEFMVSKKKRLRADSDRVQLGDEAVDLTDLDTIALIRVVENPHGATIQRYSARLTTGDTTLKVHIQIAGRQQWGPWLHFVAILEAHAVPRMVRTVVDRIRQGQEVELAGLTASSTGLQGRSGLRKVQLDWGQITDMRSTGPYLEIQGPPKLKVLGGADNRIVLPGVIQAMRTGT